MFLEISLRRFKFKFLDPYVAIMHRVTFTLQLQSAGLICNTQTSIISTIQAGVGASAEPQGPEGVEHNGRPTTGLWSTRLESSRDGSRGRVDGHRGRICETGPAITFFDTPRTREAQQFMQGELVL